jgi:hypothetical protein
MPPASPDNIIVHDSLFSGEDLNKMLSFCKSQTTWSNSIFYSSGKLQTYPDEKTNFHNATPEVFNLFVNILNLIKDKIEWSYGTRVVPKENEAIRRWSPGEFQDVHADSELSTGEFISLQYITDEDQNIDESEHSLPNDFVDFSSVFYINDDYKGGELFFPEYDIKIKAKSGSFITWPSNAKYLHGVNKVIDGYRYTIPSMWYSEKAVLLNSIKSFKCARSISKENYSNKFVKTSVL